ncbi:MAG: M15 family metallopeptidase [Rhodanobacteraceae bacterium]|nr:M15 family metallopeptidase [Rhodanobacteraceae bacterium]
MSTVLLSRLTPDTRAKAEEFLAAAEGLGYEVRVVSTLRTCAEQAALYELGRTKPGKVVTNARGCTSWHVLGRAFDITITKPARPAWSDWRRLGELGESLGFVWGGRFKGLVDGPHYEWHPGKRIEDFCQDPNDCKGAVARSFAWSPDGKEPWERTETPLDDPSWGGNSLG